jgi:type IV pilus assembly protein PilY1
MNIYKILNTIAVGLIMLTATSHAHAAVTDISSAPLITSSTSSVLPNVIFVLDDSGSMEWDYLPDWSNDAHCKNTTGGYTTGCCSTSGDGGSTGAIACWVNNINDNVPVGTSRGHPPFLSSDFNGVYYNPTITYTPPLNADGSSYPNLNNSTTSTQWTSVKNDAYSVQNTTSTNLITNFPDLEWCTNSNYTDCLRNNNYILPGIVNGKNYTTFHAVNASGTGSVASGQPGAATISSRSFGPHYYTIIPGEYCDSPSLRNCSATPSPTFSYPAPLRWCDSDASATAATANPTASANRCQAVQTPTYKIARYPSKFFTSATAAVPAVLAMPAVPAVLAMPAVPEVLAKAEVQARAFVPAVPEVRATATFTITIASASGKTCDSSHPATTSLRIGGVTVSLSAGTPYPTTTTSLPNSSNPLTADLINRINSSSSGYKASGTTNAITITAQAGVNANGTSVTVSRSGNSNCTITTSPTSPVFSGYVAATAAIPAVAYSPAVLYSPYIPAVIGSPYIPEVIGSPAIPAMAASYPGAFVRTDIVSSINSYAYPGTSSKAATRTDCAGTTCTYNEEMTNFANWWSYYRTRMQTMKSSASISFAALDSRYRVGYYSINQNTKSDFLNPNTFNTIQKTSWYAKLVSAKPGNGTPLRSALSQIGRLYAGKLNGSTIGGTTSRGVTTGGTTAVDPVQYSCQQNFTILSTDGYWNAGETTGNTGVKLDGTVMDDQDGSLPRPQKDGLATPDTLADVAAYYYNTDLRTDSCTGTPVAPATTGNDVCTNNVPVSGLDTAAHQHMTTFTVGLGASGYMQYSPSYATSLSGDYFDVKNGNTANRAAGVCTWQTGGVCNWPLAVGDTQTAIDDLWHTAVNGHGTYFSAGNPAVLSAGLSSALAGVISRLGASAAATTSNPNIATGDNFVFSSTFDSVAWDGELVRQQLDLGTGAVSPTKDWSAQTLLDNNTSRTIYTYDPTATNRLKPFLWANLTTAAEKAYFQTPNISSLSQFCTTGVTCLDATGKAAAAGANLVNFLRGDRSLEGASTDASKYYHQRAHVLGDIVNSEAVYTKAPPFDYADSGYSSFKSTNATRQGMVYVGANDGMLHGFDATTGNEVWAYVPSLALPNLYKLADKSYATLHQYSVDGTPTQGDVYFSGAWHTILVGGMAAGGRGYYALDITDPNNPTALWEFTSDTTKGAGYTTDANLGYTFGKPEITKLKNGTWVVLVTSGYNNVSPGDGKGYVYVLNAATGAKIGSPIATSSGNTTTPSGLAQIRAWTDGGDLDNTVKRAYGGDLNGNLWRFDVDDDIAPSGNEATLLATFQGASGNVQPITAKPDLGSVSNYPVVYVGTGRYLGVTDLTDTAGQTIYAVKDNLGTTSYGNPRANTATPFVKQTLTDTTCPATAPASICGMGQTVRTGTSLAVDFASNGGWFVDLLSSGERANNDPQLALGTIIYTTNVPNASACTVGGYSYLYFFDYKTGAPVSLTTAGVVGETIGNALATRPVFAKLPNNKVIGITRLSNGETKISEVPVKLDGTTTRRVSWRELLN